MNRQLFPVAIFLFLMISIGCKTLRLPYKSKDSVALEYRETFFYDPGSSTGFKKGWTWKFFSKKDAKRMAGLQKETGLDRLLESTSPVYASSRASYDNTPEYLLVFNVKNKKDIQEYMAGAGRPVYRLHSGMAFNFANIKDRNVSLFFAHDTIRKTINAYSIIEKKPGGEAFLAFYHAGYRNIQNYLAQIRRWYSERPYDNYVINHLNDGGQAIPDSIIMLWPFASFNNIIQTVGSYENFSSLNILKKPDSLLLVNNQISYQAALESLTVAFQEDFFEEQHYVDLQAYAQTKAFYHSFLGQYREAMECEALYKPTDLSFKLKANETVLDASAEIMKRILDKKIVAFNESHHDVRCRAFMISFLDSLRTAGFTHLAIEDLSSDPIDGEVFFSSGYYVREPLLHNLITAAIKKGFQVIAYDRGSVKKQRQYIERDQVAAKNLLKKIDLKKGDRLAIFCGYGHIDKSKDKNKPVSLVDYIYKFSDIEPFTVDLAYPRLYRIEDRSVNHFYVLKSDSATGVFHNARGSNGDMAVYPPTDLQYFDHEYYLKNKLLSERKVSVHFNAANTILADSLTVYVYAKRNSKMRGIALPVYTKLIGNRTQEIDLYLPPFDNEYLVEVRSAQNAIAMTTTIQLEPEKSPSL